MSNFLKLLLCLALGLGLAAAYASEPDILHLSDDNFGDILRQYESTMVMFYSPQCGHCQKLQPEYEKAAKLVKRNDAPIALARIDCTLEGGGLASCDRYHVKGLPALKNFHGDQITADYNGTRAAFSIAKYLRSQGEPVSREMNSFRQMHAFLGTKDSVIMGYFEDLESPLAKTFFKVAAAHHAKYRFGHTNNGDLLAARDETDAVYLHRPKYLINRFEDMWEKFEGSTPEELFAFIKKNFFGLVGHRRPENAHYFEKPLVIAYYYANFETLYKATNYYRVQLLRVAKEHAERGSNLNFAFCCRKAFQHEVDEIGFEYILTGGPLILAIDAQNRRYTLSAEFTIDRFREFLAKLLDGTLEPHLKTEWMPPNIVDNMPVKKAVARNYETVVTRNNRDTLLLFYGPWCEECQQLAENLTTLAEQLENEDGVVIVKMDATVNFIEPMFGEIGDLPQIFWLAKHAKDQPVAYKGGSGVDDFVKFIAKHATKELKDYDRSGTPKTKCEL